MKVFARVHGCFSQRCMEYKTKGRRIFGGLQQSCQLCNHSLSGINSIFSHRTTTTFCCSKLLSYYTAPLVCCMASPTVRDRCKGVVGEGVWVVGVNMRPSTVLHPSSDIGVFVALQYQMATLLSRSIALSYILIFQNSCCPLNSMLRGLWQFR